MSELLQHYRPKTLDEHWLICALLAPIPDEGEGTLLNLRPSEK